MVTASRGIAALIGLTALLIAGVAAQREITHQDLAKATVGLAKDCRDIGGRLDRHEYRERNLGEHFKKSLATMEKKFEDQDEVIESLRTSLERMEASFHQQSERQNIQLQQTFDSIADVKTAIEILSSRTELLSSTPSGVEVELRTLRERLEQQPAAGAASGDVELAEKLREASANLVASETRWRKHGADSEQLLTDLRAAVERLEKLKSDGAATPVPEDDDAPNLGSILDSLDATQQILTQATTSLEKKLEGIQDQAKSSSSPSNATLEAIAALREEVLSATTQSTKRISADITTARAESSRGQVTIVSAISEIREDTSNSLEAIRGVERVLIQTADGVLDTKRRVEYGVQQVLFETGAVVKSNSQELNTSMTELFDGLSSTILLNQTVALTNMSSRMEAEISQVWRQIGIMYRELSQSAGTLDRLQSQTESYVNGSLHTMDDMSGKVGQLSNRMGEVDDNLNYLLGRLSLVAQEFNMIKDGLGQALDQARKDFHDLQNDLQSVSASTSARKQPIPEPLDTNQVSGNSRDYDN